MKIARISICNWGLAAFLLRVKYSLGVDGPTHTDEEIIAQ